MRNTTVGCVSEREFQKRRKQEMRRACSRAGFAQIVFALVEIVGTLLSSFLLADHDTLYIIAAYLITYGVCPVAFWLVIRNIPRKVPERAGVSMRRMLKWFSAAIALDIILSLLTTDAMERITDATGIQFTDYSGSFDEMPVLLAFVILVIVAPVCEELIFRKILLRRMLPCGEMFAVVMSALAFGLFHMNLSQFFYTTALGLLFGYIAVTTGRIWCTILLHAGINGFSLLIGLMEDGSVLYSVILWLFVILLVAGVVVILLTVIKKWRKVLWFARSNEKGCWTAALTSAGFWACVIILGLLSVYMSVYVNF